MKLKYLLCLCPVALTGCAGYNHTLFMTKSNVGLDFDSKPPTLEINIARKEAVIAPSFEGGKTPPVMASFKPGTGAGGGFGSFFLGVDQTFAGGDAALAMAKLYNKPTATDASEFDSALQLNQKPVYQDWFRKIPGGGSTRPLIFGTDTSLGLKAAWTGTGGQVPDTVKLGFSRKEFAWAPITATPADGMPNCVEGCKKGCGSCTGPVKVKMPAFLATLESSQKLDTNGAEVKALQYFATGESATQLAMKREVRAAMHARLDPNSQAFEARFTGDGLTVAADILFSTATMLNRFAAAGDTKAKFYRDQLDAFTSPELPATYGDNAIPIYTYDDSVSSDLLLTKNLNSPTTVLPRILAVAGYLTALDASQQSISLALKEIEKGTVVKLGTRAANTPIVATTVESLIKERAAAKSRAEKLGAALSNNPDVEAACLYVQSKITPKN